MMGSTRLVIILLAIGVISITGLYLYGPKSQSHWVPDGEWIAFQCIILGYDGTSALYRIRSNGDQLELIEKNAALPRWSPDGGWIVFKEYESDTLAKIRPNGSERVDLTALRVFGRPSWSTNGDKVIFETEQADSVGLFEIFSEGDNEPSLLFPNASEGAWSPDGKQLALVRRVDPLNSEISIIDVENHAEQMLIETPWRFGLSWLLDSNWLSFIAANENNQWQFYRLNVTTSEIVEILPQVTGITSFEWSPDGEWLVYTTRSPSALHKSRADGMEHQILVEIEGCNIGMPTWSPLTPPP